MQPRYGRPHAQVRGTELIPQLRAAGVTSRLIIQSGNTSTADRAYYAACGADGALDKTLSDAV